MEWGRGVVKGRNFAFENRSGCTKQLKTAWNTKLSPENSVGGLFLSKGCLCVITGWGGRGEAEGEGVFFHFHPRRMTVCS